MVNGLLEEYELDVPEPPDIFKGNVYFLKNKRSILIGIFLILFVPVFFMNVDVRKDGPTYVDMDITKFRLQKTSPVEGKVRGDENETLAFGNFRETRRHSETLESLAKQKELVTSVTVGITACGSISLENAVVSVKSLVLSALNYGLRQIELHLFVDNSDRMNRAAEAMREIRDSIAWSSSLTFRFETHLAEDTIPEKHFELWVHLYKKCAATRLFILNAVPRVREILFLDADTLITGDVREIWSFFQEMDERQFAGLTFEQGSGGVSSFYQYHSRVPFVPPTGVSSGVMLLNLTRMRQFDWETKVINVLESFAQDLLLGDQDILNILFYFNREYLKIIPCNFNYRRVNCKLTQHCEASVRHPDGIQILHGNADSFQVDGDFHKVYQLFRKFDLSSDSFRKDIVLPFKWHYKKLELSKKTFSSGCIVIGRRMFNSWIETDTVFSKDELTKPAPRPNSNFLRRSDL